MVDAILSPSGYQFTLNFNTAINPITNCAQLIKETEVLGESKLLQMFINYYFRNFMLVLFGNSDDVLVKFKEIITKNGM